MTLTDRSIVAEIARQQPSTVKVFQRYGIEFCCGGDRPLAEACEQAGQDVEEVLNDLRHVDPSPNDTDWNQQPLVTLIDHILSVYHDPLRRDLPVLAELVDRVAARHGESDPRLLDVATTFHRLADEMTTHMRKEEIVLFPMIEKLEHNSLHSSLGLTPPPIDGPVAAMEDDHREVGELLERLAVLTDRFSPPEDACNRHRGLLDGFEQLRFETHQHIHLENNILFPRAQALVVTPEPVEAASIG